MEWTLELCIWFIDVTWHRTVLKLYNSKMNSLIYTLDMMISCLPRRIARQGKAACFLIFYDDKFWCNHQIICRIWILFPRIQIWMRILWFLSRATQRQIWIHTNTVFECIQIQIHIEYVYTIPAHHTSGWVLTFIIFQQTRKHMTKLIS